MLGKMDVCKKHWGPPMKNNRQRRVDKHDYLRQTARHRRERDISSARRFSFFCLPKRVPVGVDIMKSRPESAGCSRKEIMDKDMAERIRGSRGNYEVELSFTGELGLHESFIICDKNPLHLNFIRVKDFNIDHLPSRYRDSLLVEYVRAWADLTCRLSMSRISECRPDTWPDSDQAFPLAAYKGVNYSMITGTGWVYGVFKFIEEMNINCQCDECRAPGTHTPKKRWGEIHINTACHVVYDNEEARNTKCQFFYDSYETDINKVPTLTRLKVVQSDAKGDSCTMKYVTHDVELLDRFDKMWKHWEDLRHRVINKYVSKKTPTLRVPGVGCDAANVGHNLCIVVSHPHGCNKVVTVGAWTHRHVVDKFSFSEAITYCYNTPTCPGSSGAAVITLCKDIRTYWLNYFNLPSHSQGRPDNENNSGKGVELS